jgi:sugar lactone lactonase YvrE
VNLFNSIKNHIALMLIFYCTISLFCITSALQAKRQNPTKHPKSKFGNLSLTIHSGDVAANIRVIGPDKTYNLKKSKFFKDISPGYYTVLVFRSDIPAEEGERVGKAFGELRPVRRFHIKAGDTLYASVKYVEQPASGKLWVSNETGARLIAFDKNVLQAPGSPTPSAKIQFSYVSLRGFAFDKMGDLWVAGFSKRKVYAFTPGQLKGNSKAKPVVTISNGSIDGPWGLTFDKDGNMWISDWNTGKLISYNFESLVKMLSKRGLSKGSPDLTIVSSKLKKTEFITFDSSDNLWVTGQNPGSYKSEIVKIPADKLKRSGEITPSIIITESETPTLIGVNSLTFDKQGNLWGADNTAIFRFDSSQLTTSGATVPKFYRTLSSPVLVSGIALDAQGAVWIGEQYNSNIIRYKYPDEGKGTAYIEGDAIEEPAWLSIYPKPVVTDAR